MLGLKGLKESMSLNWNFQRGGGGGFKPKNPPWGEYGYFLEQHDGSTTSLRKSEQRIDLLLSLQLRHI